MRRYIDADRLLNGLKADPLYPLIEKYGIESVIDAQPTADVAEVVRCKDCRHRKKNTYCLHNMRYEDDNGFCSYGERKER